MTKRILTKAEAMSALPEGDNIHTFRNPGGMLVGADRSREEVIKAIENADEDAIEIGGPSSKNLKHALIIWITDKSPLFVESNMEIIEALDLNTDAGDE